MPTIGIGTQVRERFELRRRLGQGGMGVVWEALDRRDDTIVALKTLRHVEPRMLFRFKQEFRALADLQHPNLVRLGELFAEGDAWYFTMELVPGQSFLSWVRGEPPKLRFSSTIDGTLVDAHNVGDSMGGGAGGSTGGSRTGTGTVVGLASRAGSSIELPTLPGTAFDTRPSSRPRLSARAAGAPPLDEDRLREALPQLVAGLAALHAAGKVHRDVKPSNVLCSFDGRVVLLDFGLVTERGQSGDTDSQIVGTAAYMAPEQAASQPVGPEADWYAVGAMIFEALVGGPPFVGPPLAVLMEKQRREAPDPHAMFSGLPEDLVAIARALLARDPAARAQGTAALARLAGVAAPPIAVGSVQVPFVGRAVELGALRAAWTTSRAGEGRAVTVVVHGESGIGKSALVREFLGRVEHDGSGALVLASRCYERESVPYKAFDSLIDALSTTLSRLDAVDAALLVPHDAAALARLFPVLRRVPVLDRLPELRVVSPQELRARAFSALRELLTRLAERRPLAVFIDDFQWADKDSLALLAHVMQGAWAPPLLLVVTMRNDAGPAPAELAGLPEVRRLEVLGLAPADARGLVDALSGGARADGAAIASDAGGHPLFLQELVRFAGTGGGRARLDEALVTRARALEPGARRLLDVLAVAGEPLPVALAVEAARLAPGEGSDALPLLRAAHLVRAVRSREGEIVECYHDRVRESVGARLPPERARAIHAALAAALEARGAASSMPLSLVRHLEAAGEPARAAHLAIVAARRSADTLAFDQAAELYRTALRLGAGHLGGEDEGATRRALGDALVNAGRTAEAAEEFLVAVKFGDAAARLDCRSKAAEHLLGTGQVPRGLAVLEEVLAELGERFPATPQRALPSILWHRLRLRLRGLHFTPRDPSEIKPRDLALVDVYRSVSVGIGLVDTVRGSYFQVRGLVRALEVGEPGRIVRAMGLEAVYQGAQGGRGRARGARLIARTHELLAGSDDPFMRAWSKAAGGIFAYVTGDFQTAIAQLPGAEQIFRDETVGNAWETATARIFLALSLRHSGRYVELRRRYDEHVPDAVRRGDLYTETTMARAANVIWLAADDPRGAHDDLAVRAWPSLPGAFHMQTWYEWRARADLALYEGDATALAAETDGVLAALDRTMLSRVQTVRGEALWIAGRLALAASTRTHGEIAGAHVARAAAWARKLRRQDVPYLRVWSQLLEAGVASRRGQPERAAEILRHVGHAAETCGLKGCAAATLLAQAAVLGGELGLAVAAGGEQAFKELGVTHPGRFAAMLVPGFSGPR